MGDDHYRAGVAAHQPFHSFLARYIEVIVRLVQQQQIRLPHQQPRQPDELGLPAAEGVEGAVEGLVAQAQVAQGRADAVLVGQPARGFILVEQPGVLVHDPRQPRRRAVDDRVAHLGLGRGQGAAQPGDLWRAGQGDLQDGADGSVLNLRTVQRPEVRPCVIRVRARVLWQIADGQIFDSENRAGLRRKLPQDELE